MDNRGWVKTYRTILDNPTVCKDSDHLAVWMYLLLLATHSEYDVEFAGNRITLQAGQLITGRKAIADKFNIDESKVQRVLKKLENEHQIEQQTSTKNRLITILNWSYYQDSEQQIEQQVNNKCTTNEQRVNTNKNVNKEKKEKNVNNEKHTEVFFPNDEKLEKAFQDFIAMRKAIKKPLIGERAYKRILNKIDKLDSETAIAQLDMAIFKNWIDIYPLKEDNQQQFGKPKEETDPIKQFAAMHGITM